MNKSSFLTTCRKFWTKQKISFGKYEIVEPANVSPIRSVPQHIKTPNYISGSETTDILDYPEIKNETQIASMRDSCKLAAKLLQKLGDFIQIGTTTDEVDYYAHNLIINNNAYPSPLNYKRFPKSICTSVNNVACHGIPDDRPLKSGDIINIDITVYFNGYHGDCSRTFMVGDVDDFGRALVKATETCLNEATLICKPGLPFREIGKVISRKSKQLGYTVVPCFIGHGIGSYFHGPPDIYHFENNYPGRMEPGMTFTIEPVLSQGNREIVILDDGWTAVTLDTARTAQFEHTVLITDTGADILTLPS
ncbi:methionine aminopeptidase [Holotrichia oblita]|uniref:Methionine aminopeptidase n=1 Tax=Holotrichia oblita TaxID=644536 RepID=A0ACB9TP50_HOLOL|nr:methionine aminopeptidase [Holotrichia oblita]